MAKQTILDIALADIHAITTDNVESMRKQIIEIVLSMALHRPIVSQKRIARIRDVEFARGIMARGVAVESAVQKIMVHRDCKRRTARTIIQEALNGR